MFTDQEIATYDGGIFCFHNSKYIEYYIIVMLEMLGGKVKDISLDLAGIFGHIFHI